MPSGRLRHIARYAALAMLVAGCSEPANAPLNAPAGAQFGKTSSSLAVKAASPAAAPLDTTLDVEISGSGFEAGSRVDWLLDGKTDSRVRTNSTRFVSSTSLVANITIGADAAPSSYDVAVVTSSGKTGIGTELFTVLAIELLSGPDGASRANDVSGTGIIAGGRAGGCDSGRVPAYWRNGGPYIDLPLLAPWCNGTALYINESGVMIGRLDPTGAAVPVRWVPNAAAPSGYDVVPMDDPPSDGTTATFFLDGLNESGIVVGNRWHGANTLPYSWSLDGGWAPMPLATETGTTGCYVEAVNDMGEATGQCWRTDGFSSTVFWSALDRPPTRLLPHQDYSYAGNGRALTNFGVIVGNGMKKTKTGTLTVSLRWTRAVDGTWNSPEVLTIDPWDINDDGVIVGSIVVSRKNHAALLVPGQPMKDLGVLGEESWAFSVTSSGAAPVLVTGVTSIANYKRGTLWRP